MSRVPAERAWELSERVGRELQERIGDGLPTRKQRILRAHAHMFTCLSLLELGRYEEGLETAQLAGQSCQEAGDSALELESRMIKSDLLVFAHRLPEARSLLLSCLHDAVRLGFRGVAEASLRWGMTLVAAELRDWTTLVQMIGFLNDPTWERSNSVIDLRLRHCVADAREMLGEAAYQQAWTAGTGLQLADMVDLADLAERLSQMPIPPTIQPINHPELTPREREVLALVSQGHPDRKVARLLGISPPTASRHVGNLLSKLGLRNRVELARWAIEHARGDELPDERRGDRFRHRPRDEAVGGAVARRVPLDHRHAVLHHEQCARFAEAFVREQPVDRGGGRELGQIGRRHRRQIEAGARRSTGGERSQQKQT